MTLPAQTFTGIAPAKFAAIQAEFQKLIGMTVSGNSGTVTGRGFNVSYGYDPIAQTLTVEVLNKPMLVIGSLVEDKIKALVENA